MTNPYTFEDISRYASGDMPANEQAGFEEALQQDVLLQQQLALYREVDTSLTQQFTPDQQKQQLQQTLQQLGKAYFTAPAPAAKIIPLQRYRLPVTAAAAIIIALFIWQPWQTDLYTRYAATEMVVNVERGNSTDSLLEQATVAFNKKEFSAAASLLNKVTTLQPANSFGLFYYAVSLTHTSEMSKAREILTQLHTGNSVYKYEAAFYLALTYVKEKDKQRALIWLQKIPSDAGIYSKARELQKAL